MPVTKSEQQARQVVRAIHRGVTPQTTDDKAEIRAAMLAQFTAELDAKLDAMHPYQHLLLTFRIDIANHAMEIQAANGRGTPEYRAWRAAVYARDNYTCQECGARGSIVAHHIKSYYGHPELRHDIGNGVTLCQDCHALKHPHLNFSKRKRVTENDGTGTQPEAADLLRGAG